MVWVEIRATAKPVSSLCALRGRVRGQLAGKGSQHSLAGQAEVTPHGHVAPPHFSEDSNWSYSVIC